jgi:hypothetical protein
MLWLPLLAFALSSLGVGGFLAAICTVGIALLMLHERRPRLKAPYLLASLLALACVTFWIFRLSKIDSAGWSVTDTWPNIVFGSYGFIQYQPPGWIGALNGVVGVLVLGGVIAGLIRKKIEWWTAAVVLGLIVVSFVFRLALEGQAVGLLAVSPAVGLLAGAGLLGTSGMLRYGLPAIVATLVTSDLGLLIWWIQRAMS